MGDQDHIRQNLYAYIQGFSPAARDIFERFDFHTQIERLAKANLLYLITEKFANIDLHPQRVDNAQMGHAFEELIRKFAELKYATSLIVDCPHETPVYDEDGKYKVIRTADLTEGELHIDDMYCVNEQEYVTRIRRQRLKNGDLVYGREGERWGLCAEVPRDDLFCLGQRMMQFRALETSHSRYLMWQLNAVSTYRQGQMDTVGATSPHVNVGTIRNYVLAEPPFAEQSLIACFVDAETRRLDTLELEAGLGIELLKERRSALITAAVTGQIDVRGLANEVAA
jgi:type I restriction enzyme S subunit